MASSKSKPGTERARDQQRKHGGPRYQGQTWEAADQIDKRYGRARNDSGDAIPDLPDTRIEAAAELAGMGRGEKPRKPKARAKKSGRRAGGR